MRSAAEMADLRAIALVTEWWLRVTAPWPTVEQQLAGICALKLLRDEGVGLEAGVIGLADLLQPKLAWNPPEGAEFNANAPGAIEALESLCGGGIFFSLLLEKAERDVAASE